MFVKGGIVGPRVNTMSHPSPSAPWCTMVVSWGAILRSKSSPVIPLGMGAPLIKAWWLGLGRGAMVEVYVTDSKRVKLETQVKILKMDYPKTMPFN